MGYDTLFTLMGVCGGLVLIVWRMHGDGLMIDWVTMVDCLRYGER